MGAGDTVPKAFEWRTTLKRRIAIAAAGLLLWSVAIEARLVYLQVVQHEALAARAEGQQSRTINAPAKRGDIVDRNGRVLAFSVDADSIYAVPTKIDDPTATAAALCVALGDCASGDKDVLAGRFNGDRAFAFVRRQATPDQTRRVANLDLDGVGFIKENRRFYPNKQLAAHLLGYVGVDGDGLGGIEAAYDDLIKGLGGLVLIQTDARGRPFSRVERPATVGGTLELTIDQYLQHVAERELRVGVELHEAAGGTAIVMEPNTGEILALANWPTFNPNVYNESVGSQRRNRAVQDIYEPGSTFKIVIASAALEEQIVVPSRLFDLSGGEIRFGARLIRDTRDYGILSFEDVIVKSSNVGVIQIGLELGAERVGEYVDRFGFGRRASPDFPGESSGIVWDPRSLNDSALASVAMGYQVSVTPLQMVAAMSAVANGGELLEPRIVRSVVRDGQRIPVTPTVRGRVINHETAAILTTIMEQVVERGTGTQAQVPGYTVAGKTGTAKKLVDGSYQGHSDYNASFVGFTPSPDPEFAILVVIDSPKGPDGFYAGGSVAAPVFQRIAAAALRHRAVPPSIDPMPPLLVERRDEERAHLASVPAIVTLNSSPAGASSILPDLRGLWARDALRVLSQLGLSATLRGDGVVVEQQPAPGTTVILGEQLILSLRRETLPSAVNDAGP
jgi:cell division protein FtsI (penicillin-binding protein 3)